MDLAAAKGESDSLIDSTRRDTEELISLLDDYKHAIEQKCEAKSGTNLTNAIPSKECAARTSLVEKMVLIKRKSFAPHSTNPFCKNQLAEGDVSKTIHEDDAAKKVLVSESQATDCSDAGNAACTVRGAVNLADLEEMISLLNDSLIQEQECKDVVEVSQAHLCSEQARRLTLVEEMLMEKRRSYHSSVPINTCRDGYIIDANDVQRKVVNVSNIRAPKKH